MEVYKRETEEIIRRFMAGTISFPECIAALDAALAGFMPVLANDTIDEVRKVMLDNNEIVMTEMQRRGSAPLFKDAKQTKAKKPHKNA